MDEIAHIALMSIRKWPALRLELHGCGRLNTIFLCVGTLNQSGAGKLDGRLPIQAFKLQQAIWLARGRKWGAGMPRFYFDLRNGHVFLRDEEGVEVRDHHQAISEAQAVISQMQEDGELEPSGSWALIIRTEGGATVGTLDIV